MRSVLPERVLGSLARITVPVTGDRIDGVAHAAEQLLLQICLGDGHAGLEQHQTHRFLFLEIGPLISSSRAITAHSATVSDLLIELTKHFVFYNTERKRQSLVYDTPDEVCHTAIGGGAGIVDIYSETENSPLNY